LSSHYDFKLTLLIGTPAITLALYAKQTLVEEIRSHHPAEPHADSGEAVTAWTLWGLAIGLFASFSNYLTQKEICELVIDKFTVLKH
jgi:hypothetical protein